MLNAEHVKHTRKPLTIAVDMPCLIHKNKDVAMGIGGKSGGMNHATRNLFHQVLHLIKTGAQLIFVYDGPETPNNKRGVGRKGIPQYKPYEPARAAHLRDDEEKERERDPRHIECLSKKMLQHLRIEYRDEVGEAEAECAALNEAKLVDAVLTADDDAFVFGATTVYTLHTANEKEGVMVRVYRLEDLVPLTRPNMQVLAVLAGGDYSNGLKGCGPLLALQIARTENGQELLTLGDVENDNEQPGKWRRWEQGLVFQLRTNTQGFFRHSKSCGGQAPVNSRHGRDDKDDKDHRALY